MERFSQLEDLVPDVLLSVPECPDRIALHALSHVLSRFLKKSKAWQDVFTADTTAGSGILTLKSFPSAMVESVLSVEISSSFIPKGYYGSDINGVVTVFSPYIPASSETDGASVRVALITDAHSSYVPDRIIREVSDCLVYGACRDILLLPKTPYTNPNLSSYYDSLYRPELKRLMNKYEMMRGVVSGGFSS